MYIYDVGSLFNSLSFWHGVNVFHREYYVVVSCTLRKCSCNLPISPCMSGCVNKNINIVCARVKMSDNCGLIELCCDMMVGQNCAVT